MDIITKRLTVRRIAAGDWESIKRIWEDQKQSKYAGFDKPNDTDPESVRTRIEKWASFADSTEHMFFAVCLDETVIGYLAFNRRKDGYETGYCFHSKYHGMGYAKESMLAVIRAIRDKEPDAVITAGTAIENIPSVRLLRSLAFRQVGTERLSFYRDREGNAIFFEGALFERSVQD